MSAEAGTSSGITVAAMRATQKQPTGDTTTAPAVGGHRRPLR